MQYTNPEILLVNNYQSFNVVIVFQTNYDVFFFFF